MLNQEFYQLCADSTPSFLKFFDLSIAPSLLYYAYIPIILLSMAFAVFLFRHEKNTLQGKLMFSTILFFIMWVASILVQWVASYQWMIYRSWQMTSVFEILLYVSALYFSFVFINKGKDISHWAKIALIVIVGTVSSLTFTSFNIGSYDFINCQGIVGPMWYFIYGFEIFTVLIVFIYAVLKSRESGIESDTKKQIKIFGIGMTIFLGLFSFSNIFAEIVQFYQINLIGPLGMIIFLSSLSYIVIKFRAFHAKALSTQFLVYAIWAAVLSLIFINNLNLIHIITTATFILLVFVGNSLVKSVKIEVEQKEKLEKLSLDLVDANEKLQSLDKMKTEFLSLASHQLRSPLTAIKGYTSMLLEGSYGKVPDDQRVAIDRVFQSSNNLTQIVEDLLDVTKIEQGGMQYLFDDLDLVKIAKSITDEYQMAAKNKGLTLVYEGDSDPAIVSADSVKMRQVLINYLDNALKYTPKGTVTVSVHANRETKKVVYSVKDSGMGIAPEIMQTLFKKFERGEGGKVNAGGSGLGLYLAKEIVTGHKGRTWAESEGREKGSTFLVELDLK